MARARVRLSVWVRDRVRARLRARIRARVERPKSRTHGTLSALSSTFSGLRSRWMMLCACTASMPRATPASSVAT